MNEHTPGPWRAGAYVVLGKDNETVVDCQFGSPMTVADARLIAAAPELLEQLKDMTKRVEVAARLHGNDDDVIAAVTEKARAAIAQAEGLLT